MPALLLPSDVARRLHQELAQQPALEVIVAPEEEAGLLSAEQLARIEAAFFNLGSGMVARRKVLGSALRAPNLRWLHLGHSGVDDPAFQTLLQRGVVVTNSAGVTAEPIAQSAIAALLALNRGLPHWLDAQHRHAWEPTSGPPEELPDELGGQTLVVFGLGSIGTRLASYARVFGLYVIGVRRTPAGAEDGIDEWESPDRLAEVVARADVLALTAPLTAETRGIFDAAMLDRLPPRAIILNVSRGELLDEAALAARLASGRLGGAYLDVFEQEPLPPDSPLWDLPNAIISPHDSARSAGTQPRVDAIFLEEVARWLRGEESPRRVRAE
jgi:phosphoglycerate dehydrogenase-like enzyme